MKTREEYFHEIAIAHAALREFEELLEALRTLGLGSAKQRNTLKKAQHAHSALNLLTNLVYLAVPECPINLR